ncbi:MAG: adenylate kinase [Pseudomonadota bacterium]
MSAQRIVILGNAAGGKSTLARHLAQRHGLKHVEIDALYWQPDWSPTPQDTYDRHHDAAIAKDSWIIDGGGDLASIKRRLTRATEVILLDFPLWIHYWRAAERQIAWSTGALEYPPAGGQDMPPTKRLFEIIWEVDRDWMPVLRELCDAYERQGKDVSRICDLDSLAALYAAPA